MTRIRKHTSNKLIRKRIKYFFIVFLLICTYLLYEIVNLTIFKNEEYESKIASQSLEIYKRFFLPAANIEIHRIKELHKLERFGYKGGRCECFRIGKFKNIYL